MRYLVLMALILGGCGFVEIPCGPSNCGGCCDKQDKCWPGDRPFACGSGGNFCHSCTSKQACMAGSCEGLPDPGTGGGGNGDSGGGGEQPAGGGIASGGGTGEPVSGGGGGQMATGGGSSGGSGGGGIATGGGSGGGGADAGIPCGPNNCDGCCNSAGHCVSGKAHSACGWFGEACHNCSSNQTCLASCVGTPTRVGTACTGDGDCSSIGADAYCFTESSDAYPGGYCTSGCTSDQDCGRGAGCFTVASGLGACFAICAAPSSQSTCRSGYTCVELSGAVASLAFGICKPS